MKLFSFRFVAGCLFVLMLPAMSLLAIDWWRSLGDDERLWVATAVLAAAILIIIFRRRKRRFVALVLIPVGLATVWGGTTAAINMWPHMSSVAVMAVIVLVGLRMLWWSWRVLRPSTRRPKPPKAAKAVAPPVVTVAASQPQTVRRSLPPAIGEFLRKNQ